MKIIVEEDGGKVHVFQRVTDAVVCVRSMQPMRSPAGESALLPETRSYSWGGNLRELVKEGAQCVEELRDLLREAQAAERRNAEAPGAGSG